MNLEEEDEWENLDEEKGAETILLCLYCDKIFEEKQKVIIHNDYCDTEHLYSLLMENVANKMCLINAV